MSQQFQQALAELRPEDVSFLLSQIAPAEPEADTSVPVATAENAIAADTQQAPPANGDDTRRRRHLERQWPKVGTILTAEYHGQTHRATIIRAIKRLKSGRQVQILDGPAKDTIYDTLSEAMLGATEEQRAAQNLGRRGVSNGWQFWEWPGKQ